MAPPRRRPRSSSSRAPKTAKQMRKLLVDKADQRAALRTPALELKLEDPIATHDQERSLVQRLYKGRINAESFDQSYAYVWPRQRLSPRLLQRFTDSSLPVKKFWLEQEQRELQHAVLPGETVMSNYQAEKYKYYRASSPKEVNEFRTRLHREMTRGGTDLLSFDLESKIRQGKYDPVRVWLALFGVPDGFAHVVDLRVTVPGEVTTELSLREVMGAELVSLFEDKSIVIGSDVDEDCKLVGLCPSRMLLTNKLAFGLLRDDLPRGEITEIERKSGIGCLSTLIYGFHLKQVNPSRTKPWEDVVKNSGLWGWPYISTRRRTFDRLYSWPRDLRDPDALRFRLYCWLDIVTPIDVVYRFLLQRLTEEGAHYADATHTGWIEMILSGYMCAGVRPQEPLSPSGPAEPPVADLRAVIRAGGAKLRTAELTDTEEEEAGVRDEVPPPVELVAAAAAITRSDSGRKAEKKSYVRKKSTASVSTKVSLTKEERKRKYADYKEYTRMLNKPAPLRVVREGDKLRPVPDARATAMPSGTLYSSGLWWGFTGEPHEGLLAGVSRHIFQLELLYTTLPPLFYILRRVLTKITGIALPDKPHRDYNIESEDRLHVDFGLGRLFDLVMPSGYNEGWKNLPLGQRIEQEVADLLELRKMRHDGDSREFFKVHPLYVMERENVLGKRTDVRHCHVCGSPRHGCNGGECLLQLDRKYFLFREVRDGQLCSYPLCTDRGSHLTTTCPVLSSRCETCRCRGHQAEFCPGPFWDSPAEMECLRTLFEAYADLSLETDRRMINGRNRPMLERMALEGTRIRLSPAMGFHAIPYNLPRQDFEYSELLGKPVLEAQRFILDQLDRRRLKPIWSPHDFQEKYGCHSRDQKPFYEALGISCSEASEPKSLADFREQHQVAFKELNEAKAYVHRQTYLLKAKKRREELESSALVPVEPKKSRIEPPSPGTPTRDELEDQLENSLPSTTAGSGSTPSPPETPRPHRTPERVVVFRPTPERTVEFRPDREMSATIIIAMTDDGVLVTADALTIASVMIDTTVVSGRTEARADTNVTTTEPGQPIRPERD